MILFFIVLKPGVKMVLPVKRGLDSDIGPEIRRTSIAMICLSGIFLCGRLYARKLSKWQFWWDDYFITAGLVCTLNLARSGKD